MLKRMTLAAMLSLGVATGALAAGERHGGTLFFTAPYGSSFATLDVQASPNTQEEFITQAIHRALYSWDSHDNKPVLELATSEDVSADGTVHTYHLRKNAVFHNGKPLTADDIIYSYKRIANPKNAFPGASFIAIIKGADDYIAGKAEEISGLKKIDDNTLEITFTGPFNPGFQLMQNTVVIHPSNVSDESSFGKTPVGLGAFVFKEQVPGSQVVVEKFDKYYEEGKPYLDRITGKTIQPITTGQIYWGAVPFVLIQVVMIGLTIAFPQMVMHYKGATVDPCTIDFKVPEVPGFSPLGAPGGGNAAPANGAGPAAPSTDQSQPPSFGDTPAKPASPPAPDLSQPPSFN